MVKIHKRLPLDFLKLNLDVALNGLILIYDGSSLHWAPKVV